MSAFAIEVLRRDSRHLRRMLDGLNDDEWEASSACDGWTVRDVVAHIGRALQELVDLASLPPLDRGLHTETRQEMLVETTRDWPLRQVISHYDAMVVAALEQLESIATATTAIAFGALGTYPLHLAADGFAFDHYLHLREDLLAPRGPLDRSPPPTDSLAVHAALNWVLAALPQQNAAALSHLTGTVEIRLSAPGERRVHVNLDDHVVLRDGGGRRPDAVITCRGSDLVVWATKRRHWRSGSVDIVGDGALAAAFCDAIRVY